MGYSIFIDYLAIVLSIVTLAGWRLMVHAQRHQYWTLRLRLSLFEPYLLPSWSVAVALTTLKALSSFSSKVLSPDSDLDFQRHCYSLIYFLIGATLVLGIDFAYASFKTGPYLQLRWKAWSGASRTGIPPRMVQYIGTVENWKVLAQNGPKINQHPVDRFSRRYLERIPEDPTDLLLARAITDQPYGTTWVYPTGQQAGVYQPTSNGLPISLLWGENLGFQKRCSRGIVSVPAHLFKTSPMLRSGLSGKAICLAFGILSRNKGLEPRALICNLKTKNSFRQWEEAGVWPHPAKTLRGFYYLEFEKAFSLLGDSYITAATELALLLEDLDATLIGDWLDRSFEHQDLELNNLAYVHGANPEDLARLYRGHYAAMLISLSLAAHHRLVRPELIVFDAVCKLDDVPIPKWAISSVMQARRQAELNAYGPAVLELIEAII